MPFSDSEDPKGRCLFLIYRNGLFGIVAALSIACSPLGCGPDNQNGLRDGALPDAAAPDSAAPDAAQPDAALWLDSGLDGALLDSALHDAGADSGSDGGPEDATVPLAGFGDISGHCGVLDEAEWSDASPFLFRNAIDFDSLAFDENELSPGGYQIWVDGNLGGGSIHSEIFSFEVLYRCELATLLKTETFIDYLDVGGKKTDLLITIDARKVGVSVTRAYHYPPSNPYTLVEAEALLNQKLGDVILSAANAQPWDAWERSILHVIAYNAQYADAIESAFYALDPSVTADTILMVTVTDGDDAFVY
ncbi:MAG: hypothetical protein RBU30_18060 [Polyangia bacterium]|jgi:hypothetical protein|nr:hypothetical protein [Polyangia bacterium]